MEMVDLVAAVVAEVDLVVAAAVVVVVDFDQHA